MKRHVYEVECNCCGFKTKHVLYADMPVGVTIGECPGDNGDMVIKTKEIHDETKL